MILEGVPLTLVEFEQRVLQVDRVKIHYQVGGSGEPLVMLHGLSGSSRWWDKNSRVLAEHFRVHVVDLVGFGRSRGQLFVLNDTIRLLLRWMELLGETSFHLIGHSMGGLISAAMAARSPQQIDRLVLVDPAALPIGRSLVRSTLSLFEALPSLPIDFLPVLAWDAARAGPLTLLRAVRDIYQADITADLSHIEACTMIVWGEKDTLLPVELGNRLHEAMPAAEYHVIGGAGHNPMWDKPDEFNKLVLKFLDGSQPA